MGGVNFQQVSKWFGDRCALDGVDITVPEGEFCVFVGPSGCGKSTLLRMLAGLEEPSAGTISIGGAVVNGLAPRDRDIAMVFQTYALYPHMSVGDNIGFPLRMIGMAHADRQRRVAEVAALLGIEAELELYPRQLSGGQRQRVAMGRAIVRDPEVFLFDEPLSNLDAALRVQMRLEIAQLHRRLGSTTIYVTHDQTEAMTLADRIVVINAGRVEQQGDPLTIYQSPASVFVAGFIGTPAMNLLPARVVAADGVAALRAGDTTLPAPRPLPAGLDEVTLGIRPEHLTIGSAGTGQLAGMVEMVERLGSETIVLVRSAASPNVLRLKLSADLRLAIGEPVGICIELPRLHLFDDKGRAVGSG